MVTVSVMLASGHRLHPRSAARPCHTLQRSKSSAHPVLESQGAGKRLLEAQRGEAPWQWSHRQLEKGQASLDLLFSSKRIRVLTCKKNAYLKDTKERAWETC